MVKIMYLSPVAHRDGHDDLFADMARDYKMPGTEVHVTSLPGETVGHFSHIEFRSFEGMVTAGIIRASRAAAREGFDALVIGCFYDTGLPEAREVSGDMIVTAPCVASCEIAASLSNRFGVIVGRRKWVDQMQATVWAHGHRDRLAGFYHVDLGVTEFQEDHARTEERLLAAGRKAVEEDYAESLILGCTMEVGFYKTVEDKLGVPVIDPSIAALKRAEYGAHLKRDCGWTPSRVWSCEAPPEQEIAAIGSFDHGPAFGGRIVVPAEEGARA
jgi:allantoin racemase